MDERSLTSSSKRPKAVAFLAIINGLAFILTLVFWLAVLLKKIVPPPNELTVLSERANAATTYGFAIGDLIWSTPLLLLSCVGLWRMRFWGWTAAQMTNALWIYSMTVVLIRDFYTTLSPGGILFTPFALIAFWATYYLWKRRELFWGG
jgi:hypothetical protein